MSAITLARAAITAGRGLLTRGRAAARGAANSKSAQRVGAITGAAAVTGAGVLGFLSGDEENSTTAETSNTQTANTNSGIGLSKSELGIIKFPLDIESAPVPHILIKIFETQTGAVERTDQPTTTFLSGLAGAVKKADELNVGTIGAGAAGAIAAGQLALTPAALLALGGRWKAAATVVAGGAAVGGAAAATVVGTGGLEDLTESAANQIGEVFNIKNTSDRFKSVISNFALKRNIEQLRLAIALLMPETLSVSYQNNYDSLSFTDATGAIGMAAQALGSNLGNAGDAANPYLIEGVGRLAGTSITEEFKRIGLFATTGRTVNPQLEVIYNSPSLREFTMDFRLVPRNPTEAAQINILIKQLKYFASPQIPKEKTGGRYFIPPAQFELEFYDANNNQNQFLFRTKKCVLEDISVDFSGTGSFNTFYDGSPVETRLSLRFRETVFIDREAVDQGY